MKVIAAPLLALALSGCLSIVSVQADHGRPHITIWPGGVTIARGPSDAVRVRQITLGAAMDCGVIGLGLSSIDCTTIDPQTCGVAVIEGTSGPLPIPLSKASDRVRDICLRGKEPTQ